MCGWWSVEGLPARSGRAGECAGPHRRCALCQHLCACAHTFAATSPHPLPTLPPPPLSPPPPRPRPPPPTYPQEAQEALHTHAGRPVGPVVTTRGRAGARSQPSQPGPRGGLGTGLRGVVCSRGGERGRRRRLAKWHRCCFWRGGAVWCFGRRRRRRLFWPCAVAPVCIHQAQGCRGLWLAGVSPPIPWRQASNRPSRPAGGRGFARRSWSTGRRRFVPSSACGECALCLLCAEACLLSCMTLMTVLLALSKRTSHHTAWPMPVANSSLPTAGPCDAHACVSCRARACAGPPGPPLTRVSHPSRAFACVPALVWQPPKRGGSDALVCMQSVPLPFSGAVLQHLGAKSRYQRPCRAAVAHKPSPPPPVHTCIPLQLLLTLTSSS